MSIVLDHLKAVASEFSATVTAEESDFFTAYIDVVRPGGTIEAFHLRIVGNEAFPKVCECDGHMGVGRSRQIERGAAVPRY
jgi:hypothetical protein